MTDVSGLIIGLPGLVVACADLYQLTVTGRNFDHDVRIIVCRAAVQQMKFAYWLQSVGFVENTKPTLRLPPIAQNTVKRHLESIKTTLTLLSDLIDEYELPSDDSQAQGMVLPEPFWRLLMVREEPTSSSMRKRMFHSKVKPIKWAAAQQQRAEKLLGDLQSLNEGLDWVSGNCANQGTDTLPSRMLPHIWGEDNLRAFIEATAQYEPELARCVEMKQQVIAATKSIATTAQASSRVNRSPLFIPPLMISNKRGSHSSRMAVAELKDKATGQTKLVLLEDKTYAGRGSVYEQFVEFRVGELAMILAKSPKPGRMRVLNCIGYTQNRIMESFSLVFNFPEHAATNIDPISLQDLLPPSSNGWAQRHRSQVDGPEIFTRPSLRTRFAMAQSLCQSVSLLQACGVLHKAIAAPNVLFFKNKTCNNTPEFNHDLNDPILTGFTWARLHGSEFVSDGLPSKDFSSTSGLLHSHPAYSFDTEQRYLKIFDLYGLGLVLLQIGVWRNLGDITDEIFPSAKSTINKTGSKLDEIAQSVKPNNWLTDTISQWQDELVKQQRLSDQSDGITAQESPRRSFQDALVKNVQKLLLNSMGEIYTKVVARCLTGDIQNDGLPQDVQEIKSDEAEPEYILQDAIARNIIKELEKCQV